MKLIVQVIEARDLLAMDNNGLIDPYVKLQLGRQRAKSKVVKKSLNPIWDEQFSFRVGDLKEELCIFVLDEDKYFADDFLGQIKVPLSRVLDSENLSLGTQWYQLQPKSKKSKIKTCGEICLNISLSQNSFEESALIAQPASEELSSNSDKSSELKKENININTETSSNFGADELDPFRDPLREEKSTGGSNYLNKIFNLFSGKNTETNNSALESVQEESNSVDSSEISVEQSIDSNSNPNSDSNMSFEEMLKEFESKHTGTDTGTEIPENLPGGILIDQIYAISPSELNSILLSPNSNFLNSLAESQGNSNLQVSNWKLENEGTILKRSVTYTRPATKLVKSVNAFEEQNYIRIESENFALLCSVSTPDVPFGNCFKTELLFRIKLGPELGPERKKSAHLVISWRVNFSQSTMMKSMIENGAKQGLKESFDLFAENLGQIAKVADLKDLGANKEQILGSLQPESESDWRLALRFFRQFYGSDLGFCGNLRFGPHDFGGAQCDSGIGVSWT
ncbi:hypothetical protein LUZ60_000120 [Juncus effusus]|nr:hypothetical protein LUZ60_000120 [Juncus effusus]